MILWKYQQKEQEIQRLFIYLKNHLKSTWKIAEPVYAYKRHAYKKHVKRLHTAAVDCAHELINGESGKILQN